MLNFFSAFPTPMSRN